MISSATLTTTLADGLLRILDLINYLDRQTLSVAAPVPSRAVPPEQRGIFAGGVRILAAVAAQSGNQKR